MQLKTLEESLSALARVKELAVELDAVLTELRPALAKLSPDLRDSVTMEIHDVVDKWLAEIDGSTSAIEASAVKLQLGRPQINKDSLAAKAFGVLKTCGAITMGQLVNELKQRSVAGADTEAFRATLTTALWRRKDVFERKGNLIHLRASTVELVD